MPGGGSASVTPPAGPAVSYASDIFDRLLTAQRGGLTTTLGYNRAGQKTSMSDPDMGNWSYAYDGAGNLTSQTDARGCTLYMTYDPLYRLTPKKQFRRGLRLAGGFSYVYDAYATASAAAPA